jgi:sorting nexin-29
MNISDVLLLEEQNGFRKGRSCTDDIFTIRQIIEKRREFNLETHIAFIDYEKAFDRENRATVWQITERRGYPRHLICAIKSLYQNTTIILDMNGRYSKDISTNQGVRQGCSLSPNLFNIYLDDVIREWKTRSNPGIWLKKTAALNTLLFADETNYNSRD